MNPVLSHRAFNTVLVDSVISGPIPSPGSRVMAYVSFFSTAIDRRDDVGVEREGGERTLIRTSMTPPRVERGGRRKRPSCFRGGGERRMRRFGPRGGGGGCAGVWGVNGGSSRRLYRVVSKYTLTISSIYPITFYDTPHPPKAREEDVLGNERGGGAGVRPSFGPVPRAYIPPRVYDSYISDIFINP